MPTVMHLFPLLALFLLVPLLARVRAVPTIPSTNSLNLYDDAHALAPRGEPGCFLAHVGHTMQPLIASDCFEAARLLNCDPKLLEVPMIFSRDKTKGYQVPEKVTHGSCNVIIDIVGGDELEDTETIALIGATALQIITACVVNPRFGRLGGRQMVGSSGSMWVIVAGEITRRSSLGRPRTNFMPLFGGGPGKCGWLGAGGAGGSGSGSGSGGGGASGSGSGSGGGGGG